MVFGFLPWIDAIALLLIILGGVQGLLRGLSGELALLLGALLAWITGVMLYEPLGNLVAQHTRLDSDQARIFTFLATAIAALILLLLFQKIIKGLISAILSKGFDRLAGLPAGLLRMTALVSIVFIAVRLTPDSIFRDFFGPPSLFGKLADRFVPTARQKWEDADLPRLPFTAPRNERDAADPASETP